MTTRLKSRYLTTSTLTPNSGSLSHCFPKSLTMASPRVFILDVDGIMTTGQFLYDKSGKVLKVFGPDDHDALSLLSKHLEIRFVTGDKKGFDISKKRIVDDMSYRLDLVSTLKRFEWISNLYPPQTVVYMGDGIFDHLVLKNVFYGISTVSSDPLARTSSDYVTQRSGGERAVAEACLHLLDKFFTPYLPHLTNSPSDLSSEHWIG